MLFAVACLISSRLCCAACLADRLLDAILDICGCPPEKFRSICSAIDKLDKMEWAEVGLVEISGSRLAYEADLTGAGRGSCAYDSRDAVLLRRCSLGNCMVSRSNRSVHTTQLLISLIAMWCGKGGLRSTAASKRLSQNHLDRFAHRRDGNCHRAA